MLKIIFSILLFLISIVLFTILYIYYKLINQKPIPTLTQKPTQKPLTPTRGIFTPYPTNPRATTKYPLTEQTIKALFTSPQNSNYITPFSRTIYEKLMRDNIKEDIINRFLRENPNNPPTFNCYILYTNIFYPSNGTTQQGSVMTFGPGNSYIENQVQESSNDYQDEYDIIGSYFFQNFYKYLPVNTDCKVYYYDYLKKIIIDKECLVEIYNNIRETDPNNTNYTLFTQGEMPMDLDLFIPKISRFLYYNYRNNPNTNIKYISWLQECLS